MKESVDLSKYNNSWYHPGAGVLKRLIWYYVNILIFNNGLFPFNFLKVFFLKLFGAKIGIGVVIKPGVNIKYPWFLNVGSHSWIGEEVWIDNLTFISIGEHCCLSQGAMLLTGNHDYTRETFDLMVKPIKLENGVWIGAKAIVTPGVVCYSHSVLSVGSVAVKDLEAYGIYKGNPAEKVRQRLFNKEKL